MNTSNYYSNFDVRVIPRSVSKSFDSKMFYETTLILHKQKIPKSLKNSIINGDFYCTDCYFLKSLENAPLIVNGSAFLSKCMRIESLEGIAVDYFKEINGTLYLPSNIKSGFLNILKIKELETIDINASTPVQNLLLRIINEYLRKENQRTIKCKQELIESGLGEFI
jgi:hypothetical protein